LKWTELGKGLKEEGEVGHREEVEGESYGLTFVPFYEGFRCLPGVTRTEADIFKRVFGNSIFRTLNVRDLRSYEEAKLDRDSVDLSQDLLYKSYADDNSILILLVLILKHAISRI
jgi:hypothetical protein